MLSRDRDLVTYISESDFFRLTQKAQTSSSEVFYNNIKMTFSFLFLRSRHAINMYPMVNIKQREIMFI